MGETFEFLKNIKDKILESLPNPSQHERDLKNFIKKEAATQKLKNLKVLLIFIFIFMGIKLFSKFKLLYLLILLILGVIFFFLQKSLSKKEKTKNVLQTAISNLKKQEFSHATDRMLEAYDIFKHPTLLNIINNFTKVNPANREQYLKILEINLEKSHTPKKKDEKLQEIENQQDNIDNFLNKHKETKQKSLTKINELRTNITNTPNERLKNEYQTFISRYEDIVELENSKIDFYLKAKEELLKLRENHIITQKILFEEKELKTLEDDLLEKSIKESYESEITDFINYETSYLEAINQYSERISDSSSQNIFEDIITEFEIKTKIL